MITIHEVLLPTNIQLEMVGGPMWNTDIIESGAGWEQANINWVEPLWGWKIRYIRELTRFDPLIAFFNARRGRAYGFLFKDWTDFSDRYVDAAHGIDISIGKVRLINGVYRIVKEYPDDVSSCQRIIQRPLNGTVTLSGVSGTPVVDYTTGIVSGATSEGDAAFEFNVPVRFGADKMEFRRDPAIGEWADVAVQEIRCD